MILFHVNSVEKKLTKPNILTEKIDWRIQQQPATMIIIITNESGDGMRVKKPKQREKMKLYNKC